MLKRKDKDREKVRQSKKKLKGNINKMLETKKLNTISKTILMEKEKSGRVRNSKSVSSPSPSTDVSSPFPPTGIPSPSSSTGITILFLTLCFRVFAHFFLLPLHFNNFIFFLKDLFFSCLSNILETPYFGQF